MSACVSLLQSGSVNLLAIAKENQALPELIRILSVIIQNIIGVNGYSPVHALQLQADAQPFRTDSNYDSQYSFDSPARQEGPPW